MGELTTNSFVYLPGLGVSGTGEKASFDAGMQRVDTRLGKQIFVGDPLYGTTFAATVTAVGASSVTLIIPPGNHIAGGVTIPSTLHLEVLRGAIFTIANGFIFTVNGTLDAGAYQIFSCTGTGAVAGLTLAIPDWFGTGAAALQSCMDSCKTTFLLDDTTYEYTGAALYPPENHTITSNGPTAVLYRSDAGAGLYPYNYVTLRNFTLRGAGTAYVGGQNGITVLYNSGGWVDPGGVVARDQADMTKWRGAHLTVDGVTIEDWPANGLGAGPWSVIKDTIVQDTNQEGLLIPGDYCQIINPTVKNTPGWGIDINASYTTILGGHIYSCGDRAAIGSNDMGAIVFANHTQSSGMIGNKIIGTTINTSDGPGIQVIAPTTYDYILTDIVIDSVTIKNVNAATTDTNHGAITIVDNSTSGTKVDRININNVTINTTTVGHGITVAGCKNVLIDNYNIKDVDNIGIFIYTGTGAWEGVHIGQGTVIGYDTNGIHANGGTKLTITGAKIKTSTAAGAYNGILLSAVTKFAISDAIIDLDTTGAKAPVGVFLTGATGKGVVSGCCISNCDNAIYYDGTGDYLQIYGNELSDTNTAKLYTGGLFDNSVAAYNLGHPTTPAVPASTVAQDNANTFPVRVTFAGADVSVVAIGPTGATVATGATTGTVSVILQPSWDIALTYASFSDATGDTDGTTAVITGLTSTTGFSVGGVVTVTAGFPAVVLTVVSKTATTLTLDVASTSAQVNVTVDQAKPTWKWLGI